MLETFEYHYPNPMYDVFSIPDPTRDGMVPKHKHTTFAAGEQNFEFAQMESFTQMAILRGCSGDDLVALRMWADAVRQTSQQMRLIAVIPYLPGARSDRVEPGVYQPLGAKVYADIINDCKVDRVIAFDPHSDVAPALYNRLVAVQSNGLIDSIKEDLPEISAVIAPDLGAAKRAERVADILGVPCYQASKHRDFKTKKLSGFVAPQGLPEEGTLLVVDDICDGGGTFVGLAMALGIPRQRLALWVTHGVFTYDAPGNLDQHYSWIGTTDSHPGSAQVKAFTSGYVLDLQEWLTSNKEIRPLLQFQ